MAYGKRATELSMPGRGRVKKGISIGVDMGGLDRAIKNGVSTGICVDIYAEAEALLDNADTKRLIQCPGAISTGPPCRARRDAALGQGPGRVLDFSVVASHGEHGSPVARPATARR